MLGPEQESGPKVSPCRRAVRMLWQSVFGALWWGRFKVPALCRLLDPPVSRVHSPTGSLPRGSFPWLDTSNSVSGHRSPAIHPSWVPLDLLGCVYVRVLSSSSSACLIPHLGHGKQSGALKEQLPAQSGPLALRLLQQN